MSHKCVPHILAVPGHRHCLMSPASLRAKQLTPSPSGVSTVTQQSDRHFLPLMLVCNALHIYVWRKFGGALHPPSENKNCSINEIHILLCGSTTYANSPLVQYKCNLSWKIMRWPHAYSRTRATKISTCGQSGVMASVVKKKFDGGSSMALQVMQFFLQHQDSGSCDI